MGPEDSPLPMGGVQLCTLVGWGVVRAFMEPDWEGSLALMGALTARGRHSGPGGAWWVWREMGAKGAWGTSAHLPGALFSLCC